MAKAPTTSTETGTKAKSPAKPRKETAKPAAKSGEAEAAPVKAKAPAKPKTTSKPSAEAPTAPAKTPAGKPATSKTSAKAPAVDKAPPPRRTAAARKPAATPKPRASSRTAAASGPRAAVEAAAAKVSSAAQTAAQTVSESAPVQFVADTREKMGDRNFFATVIGGVAAIGAAVAGIFYALQKGQGGPQDSPTATGATAHQADGTDSSASFEAGIADEGTVPEKLPD